MKKILALILAGTLVFGLSTIAFADAGGKITGVNRALSDNDYSDLTVNPNSTIEIPITANIFTWESGEGGVKEPVTKSQLNSGKISYKVTYGSKSKDIIESIDFSTKTMAATDNKSTAYLKIEFIEEYTQAAETKFDFTVYLTYNGNRISDSAVKFEGVMKRPTILVDSEETYVDISGGEIAETDGYIRNIDVHIGDGLIIRTKLFENKKYFGTAEQSVTEEDSKILDVYPEITRIYTLKTSGLETGKVVFEDLESMYYVYDVDGKYMGTTDEELKYSKKYFLATEKIKIGSSSSSSSTSDEEEDIEEDVEEDEIIPSTEDDYTDVPSNNSVNDNPSTGIKAPIAIVIFASLLALAIALILKKNHD